MATPHRIVHRKLIRWIAFAVVGSNRIGRRILLLASRPALREYGRCLLEREHGWKPPAQLQDL